jgi:hypothetical protein
MPETWLRDIDLRLNDPLPTPRTINIINMMASQKVVIYRVIVLSRALEILHV